MEFSPKQDQALRQVDAWLKDPSSPQVFRLFGNAGTGKTTLAKEFAKNVVGDVYFGAFTGKAAYVLQQKGCPGAMTIHQMIYSSREKGQARLKELEASLLELKQHLANGEGYAPEQIAEHKKVKEFRKLIEDEKKNLMRPSFVKNMDSIIKGAKLIIIDEVSMVDQQMGEDLLSFGVKVLVLGDPDQLPPIGGAGFFTENCKPDIMLDEIHRQAKDNPIIDMATKVRKGYSLPVGKYGNSEVIPISKINKEMALNADQIIVGRNNTRFVYNKRMRQLLNRTSEYPEVGDRLVCLRNNHDLGLLNGAIFNVANVGRCDEFRSSLGVIPEGLRHEINVLAHSAHFFGKGKEIPFYERKEAEEFDYGYALTCHKSQGSQWDKLLVLDESASFRADRNRWLYTAITRAAEQLILVQT